MLSRDSGLRPSSTWPSFQPMLKPSCIDTFMPWPAFALWVWHASPAMKTRGVRLPSCSGVTSSKRSVSRCPTSYTLCHATFLTSSVYGARISFAFAMICSIVVFRTAPLSSGATWPRSTYIRNRCPPSRGMSRMLPASDWMEHLVRMSGKSVTASTSMTPHAWLAWSPSMWQPIAARTLLRAPSAPRTYFARTTRSSPSWSPVVCASVTATGYSSSSSTVRLWNS